MHPKLPEFIFWVFWEEIKKLFTGGNMITALSPAVSISCEFDFRDYRVPVTLEKYQNEWKRRSDG